MTKFARCKIKDDTALVSSTASEPGAALGGYVWDTTQRLKQDPFFAVPSIVQTMPTASLIADDDTKVSITF
jgi:hypothetical protein